MILYIVDSSTFLASLEAWSLHKKGGFIHSLLANYVRIANYNSVQHHSWYNYPILKGGLKMDWIFLYTLAPILVFLFYIAIVVFFIWFILKVLKNQKENNEILKSIYDKIDKKN